MPPTQEKPQTREPLQLLQIQAQTEDGFLITIGVPAGWTAREAANSLLAANFLPPNPPQHYDDSVVKLLPTGEYMCVKHGIIMSKHEQHGDTWYSHRVKDQKTGKIRYCRGAEHDYDFEEQGDED